MSKKTIIIIILAATLCLFGITAGIYSLIKSQSNKPIVDNIVYIEPGLEDIAKVIKPAVENYFLQDRSEPIGDRNKRLSSYFESNSPVYKTITGYTESDINKTTAKVTSITRVDALSLYGDIAVTLDMTFYSKLNTTTETQTYWVNLTTSKDGSVKPYSIWKPYEEETQSPEGAEDSGNTP